MRRVRASRVNLVVGSFCCSSISVLARRRRRFLCLTRKNITRTLAFSQAFFAPGRKVALYQHLRRGGSGATSGFPAKASTTSPRVDRRERNKRTFNAEISAPRLLLE